MRTIVLTLAALAWTVAAAHAQDKTGEDIIKLIEKNNAGLRQFTCEGSFNAAIPYLSPTSEFQIHVGYKQGEMLGIDLFLDDPQSRVLLNWVYLPEGFAYKFALGWQGNAAFLVAAKSPRTARNDTTSLMIAQYLHVLLMDANLIPATVLPKGAKVGKAKIGDVEYLTLTVSNPIAQLMGQSFSLVYHVNSTTGRVERIAANLGGVEQTTQVQTWHDMGGVKLPALATIEEVRQKRVSFARYYNFADKAPEKPYWIADPSLPLVTSLNPNAIDQKIEKDKNNASLYLQAANALFQSSVLQSFNTDAQVAAQYKKYAKKAFELKKDSMIAQEMILSAALGSRDEETAKAIIDSGKATPGSLLMRALDTARGDLKSAAKIIETLPDDGMFGAIKKRVAIKSRFSAAATADDMLKVAEETVQGEEAIALANDLEPAVTQRWGQVVQVGGVVNDKDKSFASKLVTSKNDLVKLLGARALTKLGETKVAAKAYLELAKSADLLKELRPEIETFVRQAPGDSGELILLVVKEGTDDLGLLSAHATQLLEAGQVDKAKETIARLNKALKARQENMWLPQTDIKAMQTLLEKLVAAKEADLALKTLRSTVPLLSWPDQGMTELIKKIVAGDKEKTYDVLKQFRDNSSSYLVQQFGLQDKDVQEILLKRRQTGALEIADYRFVARTVRDRQRTTQESADYLTEGVGKFPDALELSEALGDAYYLTNRFKEAAEAYASTAKKLAEGKSRGGNYSHVIHWTSPEQPLQYYTTSNLIEKLAWAYVRAGDKPAARQAVQSYEKENKDKPSHRDLATAYEIAEDYDRAIVIYKRVVFKKEADYSYDPVDSSLRMVRLLQKQNRVPEGFLVAERALQMLKTGKLKSWNDQLPKALQKACDDLNSKLGDDYFVKSILDQKFSKLADADEKKARDLIDQLSSDNAAERQGARDALSKIGKEAAYLFKEPLDSGDPELKSSLRGLLQTWAREELLRKLEIDKAD